MADEHYPNYNINERLCQAYEAQKAQGDVSWKEIGRQFNIDPETARSRVKRFRKHFRNHSPYKEKAYENHYENHDESYDKVPYFENDRRPQPAFTYTSEPVEINLPKVAEDWNLWDETLQSFKDTITVAVCNDLHIPDHDDRAFELWCKIVSDVNPDIVNMGSDFLDFPNISNHFAATPEERTIDVFEAFEPHYIKYTAMMRDAASRAIFPFIIGNHEIRLRDYLASNVPQFRNTLNKMFVNIVKANGGLWLGWDATMVDIGSLLLMHGESASKTAHKNHLDRYFDMNIVAGHVHKFGNAFRIGYRKRVESYTTGCLCKTKPRYKPNEAAWDQGFCIIVIDLKNDSCHFQPILFNRYTAVFGQKFYST